MEDARFVRFVDDDRTVRYYATYTAYDGHDILPQLIETTDFVTFSVRTLNGHLVANKGMALFPRRIDGKFAMLSRHDSKNIHVMTSDDIRFCTRRKGFRRRRAGGRSSRSGIVGRRSRPKRDGSF